MVLQDKDIQFLVEIGLTNTQARLYRALLKMEKADARTIQRLTKVPGPAVYRTLSELQEKGFVEKEIGLPNEFKATPLNIAVQIMVRQKMEEGRRIEDKAKEFLRTFSQAKEEGATLEQDYKFVILSGRERLLQKIKQQHESARVSVDIISTLPRWLQIIEDCFQSYMDALERGVKYRVVIMTQSPEFDLTENVQVLLTKPKFNLRFRLNFENSNSAVFDRKEATFNFYPSKSLSESPLIWTNHPTFISMAQDHFEISWKAAKLHAR